MSDGNFNKALLPKNELTAGIRAGKAQMRAKAEQAFTQTISTYMPQISAEQHAEMMKHFKELLK